MALTWSATLSPTLISRRHGVPDRDVQALMLNQQKKAQYDLHKLRQRGIRSKQKGSIVLHASLGETVEEKGTDSSKDEKPSQKIDQADATKPANVTAANPFVGAKISSRIAARTGGTTPPSPTSSLAPGPQGLPPFDFNIPKSQGGSPFSPKPPGAQTFSPKPLNSQGSPFSSPTAGTEKLKGAKPSVFLDSRAGGTFKEPGPKGLLNTLRQSEERATKFGRPGVPKNLFDEPEKLTAEDKKRFNFTLNV
ncbi:hypothetical protein GOP47_0028731, partial [Adiantum capillus-veneris]